MSNASILLSSYPANWYHIKLFTLSKYYRYHLSFKCKLLWMHMHDAHTINPCFHIYFCECDTHIILSDSGAYSNKVSKWYLMNLLYIILHAIWRVPLAIMFICLIIDVNQCALCYYVVSTYMIIVIIINSILR